MQSCDLPTAKFEVPVTVPLNVVAEPSADTLAPESFYGCTRHMRRQLTHNRNLSRRHNSQSRSTINGRRSNNRPLRNTTKRVRFVRRHNRYKGRRHLIRGNRGQTSRRNSSRNDNINENNTIKINKKKASNLSPTLLTTNNRIIQFITLNQDYARLISRNNNLQNKANIVPRRHVTGRITLLIRGSRTVLLTTGHRNHSVIRPTNLLNNLKRDLPPRFQISQNTVQILNLTRAGLFTNNNIHSTSLY